MISVTTVIILNSAIMLALLAKHYIADIPLQTLWMALNKGNIRHPGGYVHAGIHAAGTLLALLPFLFWLGKGMLPLVITCTLADLVIHYLIDYTKMNIDRHFKWSHLVYEQDVLKGRMVTSNTYYWSLVGDQIAHVITYVGITDFLLIRAVG
ncbi:MAG: DUF3307 domain-containing protein [Proteobacteria bacterium]|nr:DUF3307 domain-containing protein [Pseudomonadota bacterium]